MIFFLKKEKYLLDKREVYIDFEKRLNKIEYKLFNIIIEEFKKYTDVYITLNSSKLLNNLKISKEKLNLINKSLLQKRILYSVEENGINLINGSFNLLNSVASQEDSMIYSFSGEIRMSSTEKNFFNRIHLISLLRFKSKYSTSFYLNHLMRLGDFSTFELSLSELKKLFNANESYDRFFDFEKNLLKPILDDVNCFTEYYITYEKIKNKSNRIEMIKFNGINKYSKYIKKKANELLYSARDYVDDFDSVYNELYMNLMRKGYNYVNNNLNYCLEHHKNDFSKNFKKVLDENPTDTKIEKEIDMQSLNNLS